MATDAQIAANRTNAPEKESPRPYPRNTESRKSSPGQGPITAGGKARASRNALSSGLYLQADFVLPGEHGIYAEFCANF